MNNKMKFILTSPFGEVSHTHPTPHSGIDLAMPEGTPLRAVTSGVVDKVFNYGNQNAGKGVIIQFDDHKYAIYGHMKDVFVKKGQTLNYGDSIGLSGNTGHSTGPHLHFGIHEGARYVDPSAFMDDLQKVSGDWDYAHLGPADNALVGGDSFDFAIHRVDDWVDTQNAFWQEPAMTQFGDFINVLIDMMHGTII